MSELLLQVLLDLLQPLLIENLAALMSDDAPQIMPVMSITMEMLLL